MTSAPQDLLAFRAAGRAITGLPAVEFGLAPDAAHLSSGGYHVGVEDIQRIGRWLTDYSTRQARDRRDGTNTTSAADVGSEWRNGGRAAWLRFNNLLYAEMRDRPQNLPALRAINVSLDGRSKLRFDQHNRAAGLIASKDTVDTHTHCEFWRDTEGNRGPTLDRILALMRAAVSGTTSATQAATSPTQEAFMALTDEQQYDIWLACRLQAGMDPGLGRTDDRWRVGNKLVAAIQSLQAAAAQSAQREQDMLAALTALASGGTSVDTGAVLARIDQRTADVTGLLQQQASRIAELEDELAGTRRAAEANLSPAERATLDKPSG